MINTNLVDKKFMHVDVFYYNLIYVDPGQLNELFIQIREVRVFEGPVLIKYVTINFQDTQRR